MPKYDPDEPLAEAIRAVFGADSEGGVGTILGAALGPDGRPHTDRVLLACVLLSEGDFGRLRHFLGEAARDPRDVLYWAFHYADEAPPSMRGHLRR